MVSKVAHSGNVDISLRIANQSKLQGIAMSGSLSIPCTNLRISNYYFERQPTSVFRVSCRTIMIMTAKGESWRYKTKQE